MDPTEGPDGYRYKPDELMKQSFSITTSLRRAERFVWRSYYIFEHKNRAPSPFIVHLIFLTLYLFVCICTRTS